MKAENPVGSNLTEQITNLPVPAAGAARESTDAARTFGSGSTAFTTYWTWRANGVFRAVRFDHASVNTDSRVFVAISEYGANAQDRFIGAAKMAVYNVAPFNGGFFAWVEISWGTPLNVRFDVLIDP